MKSSLKILFIFGLLLFLQISFEGLALGQTPFTGLQSQAMGGTGRAAVDADSTAFLNPASVALVSGYHIGTAYRRFSDGPGNTDRNAVVDLVENQPDTMFPLAITYMKTNDVFQNGNQSDIKEFHFTMGEQVLNGLSVGLDIARYGFDTSGQSYEAHWDYKLGAIYVPTKNLGIGLVVSDLKTTDFTFLNRNIEIAANYIFKDFFRFAADYIYPIQDNPDHSGILMLGAEHMFSDDFPIRFGYRYDGILNKNYVTAGFGWNGPKVGINYAFEKNFSQKQDYGNAIDLKIYF